MGFKSETATTVLAATAVPTSYGTWDSGWIDVGLADDLRLLCTFVKSDATSLQLKLEVEDSSGTTGFETFKVSSGTASVDEVSITASALDATHYFALGVSTVDVRRVKVHAKTTGGGDTATLALDVSMGGNR